MTYTRPLRALNQQNSVALDLAIATLIDASLEDFAAAIEQLPTEKKRELAVKLILVTSPSEKVEMMRLLPLEETGELAQAIAQVWQEKD